MFRQSNRAINILLLGSCHQMHFGSFSHLCFHRCKRVISNGSDFFPSMNSVPIGCRLVFHRDVLLLWFPQLRTADGKVSQFDFSNLASLCAPLRKSWASAVAAAESVILPIKIVPIADCDILYIAAIAAPVPLRLPIRPLIFHRCGRKNLL